MVFLGTAGYLHRYEFKKLQDWEETLTLSLLISESSSLMVAASVMKASSDHISGNESVWWVHLS
jgi:hypothetical protein